MKTKAIILTLMVILMTIVGCDKDEVTTPQLPLPTDFKNVVITTNYPEENVTIKVAGQTRDWDADIENLYEVGVGQQVLVLINANIPKQTRIKCWAVCENDTIASDTGDFSYLTLNFVVN